MKYNVYTAEFKLNVVKEFLESGLSTREFAEAKDINRNTFYAWLRLYKEHKTCAKTNGLIDIKQEVCQYVKNEINAENPIESSLSMEINGIKICFDIKNLKQVIEVLRHDRFR